MQSQQTEIATFAAGCFWGVEHTFRQLHGVMNTTVGYTGGTTVNPSYQQVCSDKTGHAEAVQIKFIPQQISYETLLNVFWNCHSPIQRNRQGLDVGSQYRSAIFYHSEEQRQLAEDSKAKLDKSGKYSAPIVTEITPASTFYEAEEYHQRYIEKHGGGHCNL